MDGDVRGQQRRQRRPIHRLGVHGEMVDAPVAVGILRQPEGVPVLHGRRAGLGAVARQRRGYAARSVHHARAAERGAAGAFGDLMPQARNREPVAGETKAHAIRHPRCARRPAGHDARLRGPRQIVSFGHVRLLPGADGSF